MAAKQEATEFEVVMACFCVGVIYGVMTFAESVARLVVAFVISGWFM